MCVYDINCYPHFPMSNYECNTYVQHTDGLKKCLKKVDVSGYD